MRSRSMLDVSYAGSPLVGEYLAPGAEPAHDLVPGERYPDELALGTSHQLLVFDHPTTESDLARLRNRWRKLVGCEIDANGAGSPQRHGAVLVGPDGHIGFRASDADAAGLAAIDAHLESYLLAR
jgi:6-methylpretetramide 4-monooxygenase / 4-hydroxy-6-methylpretetramide 12a-monooxygenase